MHPRYAWTYPQKAIPDKNGDLFFVEQFRFILKFLCAEFSAQNYSLCYYYRITCQLIPPYFPFFADTSCSSSDVDDVSANPRHTCKRQYIALRQKASVPGTTERLSQVGPHWLRWNCVCTNRVHLVTNIILKVDFLRFYRNSQKYVRYLAST